MSVCNKNLLISIFMYNIFSFFLNDITHLYPCIYSHYSWCIYMYLKFVILNIYKASSRVENNKQSIHQATFYCSRWKSGIYFVVHTLLVLQSSISDATSTGEVLCHGINGDTLVGLLFYILWKLKNPTLICWICI